LLETFVPLCSFEMVSVIILAAIGAGVVGAVIAASVFVYYKFFYKPPVRHNPDVRLLPETQLPSGWVNEADYNGEISRVEDEEAFRNRVSRRKSAERKSAQRNVPLEALPVVQPSPQQQRAPAQIVVEQPEDDVEDIVLPTDSRMPPSEFERVVRKFYNKWSPGFGDIDMVLEIYTNGDRGQLDRQLKNDYGQGLDEYFLAVKNGTDTAPKLERMVSTNSREQFVKAMQQRGLSSSQISILTDNGVDSFETLRSMDREFVSVLFPDSSDRAKIEELRAAASLASGEPDFV